MGSAVWQEPVEGSWKHGVLRVGAVIWTSGRNRVAARGSRQEAEAR